MSSLQQNWKKRAEQVLPGSEVGLGGDRGSRVQGGEMTQTMYAHVNKRIKNLQKN
jgi:hypothetical protein